MPTTTQRIHRRLEQAKKVKKDILYPPSDSESEDEQLEWVGEPLNKDTFIKKDKGSQASTRRTTRGSGLSNIPYYGGFQKGRTTYKIGDVVLLRNHQYSGKFDSPHVAQILSLWETEEKEFMGDFRWFHQEEDIAKLERHQQNGNFPKSLEKGEIVYSLDDDKNEIDTVIGKCQVMSELEWRKQSKDKKLSVKDQFKLRFCRGMVRRMTGYHAIEWKGNEEMMNMKEEKEARPKLKPKATWLPIPTSSSPATSSSTQSAKAIVAPHPRGKKRAKVEDTESEHEQEESHSESDDSAKGDEESEEEEDFESEEEITKSSKKKSITTPKKRKVKAAPNVPRRS
ncbi:hypothetical protein BGZ46_001671, partial [Entomortierella lignicola]